MKENSISRRTFLKSSALAGAAGMVGTGSVITSCDGGGGSAAEKITPIKAPGTYYLPELPDEAIEGKELKIGLIGCGGQGTGDLRNFLQAVKGIKVTALGDTFIDRLTNTANMVKEISGQDVPENGRFIGLDAYKQVIDSGVDAVMIVTPPYFRPIHFKYAVEKGIHCFMEKPLFVDSVGYRSVVATARQAQAKNLAVIVGTQRHHQRNYVAAHEQIMNGIIGEITGGVVYWNQNQLWFRERQPAWSDCEWMIRDWVNWTWLSGDHIVEQHVHNLDVFTWFSDLRPAKAIAVGARHRRVTGDQFDCFGVDFTMENGIHVASMCRQINGCSGPVTEFIQGTKGSWTSTGDEIKNLKGEIIWKFDNEAAREKYKVNSATQLELIAWVNHIRSGKSIDQASELAVSNMMAVMGREAAYTGNEVTWEAMTTSDMDLTPPDLTFTGKMNLARYTIPKPGITNEEAAVQAAARRAEMEARRAAAQQ